MFRHATLSDLKLRRLIREQVITLAGNRNLKIYGSLRCRSGKRMKKENRVFFTSAKMAIEQGYRPCGNCFYKEYKKWKNESL